MFTNKKNLERKIGNEIAALARCLSQLAPVSSFNAASAQTPALGNTFNAHAFMRQLPRRAGLERRLALYRRRLNALRTMPASMAEEHLSLAA